MASQERPGIRTSIQNILANPYVQILAAILLLAAGILASYFLGRASVTGVLAATILLLLTVSLSASIALAVSRHVIVQAVLDHIASQVVALESGFKAVASSIFRLDRRVDSLIGSLGGKTEQGVILTDAQYAALEAATSVSDVTIAIRVMGNEFHDEIAQRDAYVDFQAVVMENLRRGVHYVYITERSEINATRARRIARKTQDLSSYVRVVQVPHERWERMPFSVDTVFLQHTSGELEAYILLPTGSSKENRSWAKMAPDYRDQWWGIAEDLLEESEPLPTP